MRTSIALRGMPGKEKRDQTAPLDVL